MVRTSGRTWAGADADGFAADGGRGRGRCYVSGMDDVVASVVIQAREDDYEVLHGTMKTMGVTTVTMLSKMSSMAAPMAPIDDGDARFEVTLQRCFGDENKLPGARFLKSKV